MNDMKRYYENNKVADTIVRTMYSIIGDNGDCIDFKEFTKALENNGIDWNGKHFKEFMFECANRAILRDSFNTYVQENTTSQSKKEKKMINRNEENGTTEIVSNNGKYTFRMSKEMYCDMLDIWGIDMEKFVSNTFEIFERMQTKPGRYTFKIDKAFTDETSSISFTLESEEGKENDNRN